MKQRELDRRGEGALNVPAPESDEDDVAVVLTEMERHLLERLAQAGKPTELRAEDLTLGKTLEHRGLTLFRA